MSDPIAKQINLEELASQLVNLKVLQVNELATILKEKYNIEPAASAPVVMADTNAPKEAQEKEKTSFNVVLKSVGDAKLKVIKAIKSATGLGLKESKELADKLGAIKENLNKADADNLKSLLEEAGAEVVLE